MAWAQLSKWKLRGEIMSEQQIEAENVIDNERQTMLAKLESTLPLCERLDVAVGFFFVKGFEAVSEYVAPLNKLRILIGPHTNVTTAEVLVKQNLQAELVRREITRLKGKSLNAEPWRRKAIEDLKESIQTMNQTSLEAKAMEILTQMTQENRIEIRVYTGPFFHAKAYLFHYKPELHPTGRGQVVVGSSNFSLHGFEFSDELNLVSSHHADYSAISDWFDNRWEKGKEVTPDVLKLLQGSWALRKLTPWELFIQVAFWLTREDLGCKDTDIKPGEEKLLQFQREAVSLAQSLIERFGGVYIADVVGLGKTYIGTALISRLQKDWEKQGKHAHPLIICPPNLKPMWESFLGDFDVDADVLSAGKLSDETILKERWFRRYQKHCNLILVDEAHNFRYTGTLKYGALERLAWGKPTILLTATPLNRDCWDIYNQVRLFLPDVGHQLTLTPPNLKDYFNTVFDGQNNLRDALEQLMIRRTRRFVLSNYGVPDGKGRTALVVEDNYLYFPDRELQEPLRYDIGAVYGDATIYERLREHMRHLKLARYATGNYLKPRMSEKRPYSDLARGSQLLRGIIRTLLFKRFESSVHSFRETVQRMANGCRNFIAILQETGEFMPIGKSFNDLLTLSADELEKELTSMFEKSFLSGRTYLRKAFDMRDLIRDLESDMVIFEKMAKEVREIGPDEDDKITALQTLISKLENDGEKVLLFTEFEDTARYLFKNLKYDKEWEWISGDKSGGIASAVRRFAPGPNNYELIEGEREIEFLISTDVLSEGLNLQSARVIINYDLHWNPVRLIQRIGRVDRIGSEHEKVLIYNFLPDPKLEEHLGLEQVVSMRIQDIHDQIGEDKQVITLEERVNEEDMYAIYVAQDEDVLDKEAGEGLISPELAQMVKQQFDEEPEMKNQLDIAQLGLRTARKLDHSVLENVIGKLGEKAVGISVSNGAIIGVQAGYQRRYYFVGDGDKSVALELPQDSAIQLLRCFGNERGKDIPEHFDDLVGVARKSFIKTHEEELTQLLHAQGATKEQKWVSKQLLQPGLFDKRERQDKLLHIYKQALPLTILTRLRRFQRNRVTGKQLIKELEEMASDYALRESREPLPEDRVQVLFSEYLWVKGE